MFLKTLRIGLVIAATILIAFAVISKHFLLQNGCLLILNKSRNNNQSDYHPIYPMFFNSVPKNSANINQRTPVIFMWEYIVARDSVLDDLPHTYYSDHELNCSALYQRQLSGRCLFTSHQAFAEQADVVFIAWQHLLTTISNNNQPDVLYLRPKNRPTSKQYWIFFEIESPPHLYHYNWKRSEQEPRRLQNFKDIFNWTMTYRLDSTIPAPYGWFEPLKTPDFSRNYDRLGNKAVHALYMASYCSDRMSHREEYLEKMVEAGLNIETIGHCLTKAPRSPLNNDANCKRTIYWSTTDECNNQISARYKFYLAFENSLCQDYVTEKFYRAAALDLIPVVFNGANMSLIAPPHSYIDVKQFKSPSHLAAYLNEVGANATLYNSFFWWKPYYNVVQMIEGMNYKRTLCQLCAFTHYYLTNNNSNNYSSSKVDDVEEWWVKKANCSEGQISWPP